jgi:hypothetical protein
MTANKIKKGENKMMKGRQAGLDEGPGRCHDLSPFCPSVSSWGLMIVKSKWKPSEYSILNH